MVNVSPSNEAGSLDREGVESFLSANYTPEEYEQLLEVKRRELGANTMRSNTRVVVNMPVLYLEKNLNRALSQYLGQDLKLKGKDFVVAVYINGPNGVELETSEPYKAVLKFTKDHPELNVVIRTAHYDKNTVNISRIRKDAAALSLMDAVEVNGLDLDNLIQITHDADLQKIDPDYLSGHVEAFDENPRLGAIAGFYDYPEADFHQDHLFFATRRFEDFLEIISSYKFDNQIMKGGASAFRTRDYIAGGGIGTERKMSELRPLYKAIKKSDPESVQFSRKVGTVITSARRQMMALGEGVPLARSHDTFGEKGDLAEKYQVPAEELKIPEIANKVTSPGFKEKLEGELSSLYAKHFHLKIRKRESERGTAELQALFRKAGMFLGVKLEFNEKKVTITDMTKLRENLIKRYNRF